MELIADHFCRLQAMTLEQFVEEVNSGRISLPDVPITKSFKLELEFQGRRITNTAITRKELVSRVAKVNSFLQN